MKFCAILNFDCVAVDRLKVNCSLKLDLKDGGIIWALRLCFIMFLLLYLGASSVRLTRCFSNNYLMVLLLM